MSVSILQRPKGYILSATQVEINQIVDSAGDAYFGVGSHGLTTGDTIYITSQVENYNGFFQVDVDSANTFKIFYDQTSTHVPFIVDFNGATTFIGYYQESSLTHGVSCAHLPITYKLSNTLWPVNSVDTVRTITSLTNYSGFVQIGLSGTLGTFEDLSFIKISNAPDTDLNGVWQIIDKISTSNVILNLNYSSVNGAGILGASIQLYYGNYNIVVEVYAGINASHQWASIKPYELAATLELIPDENNESFFSINDILKAYIETRNNLLLGSLPNNTDYWTNFYISVAEQYDTSNGYTVTTNLSAFTSDLSTFEGTAINAKLAFKNIHSGYLSEYLMTNNTAKFLTLFTIPVLFSCGDDTPDCYSDISFISIYDDVELIFRQKYYLNGVLGTTNDISLGTPDSGVIRASISEADCDYDRVDVSVLTNTDAFSGADTRFTAGQTVLDVNVFIAAGQSVIGIFRYSTEVTILSGVTAGDSASWMIQYINDDGTLTLVDNNSRTTVGSTTSTNVSFPTPTKNVIGVRFTWTIVDIAPTGIDAAVILSWELLSDLESAISETKQFDIDCGCADQELRLSWLNNLGGMEPTWKFTAQKGHAIDITQASETLKNILPGWPNSYGAFADTIRKQTSRTSIIKQFVTSQLLTEAQADAIAYIKSSVLVQIINSRTDRRTVGVDTDSFLKKTDGDKTFTISFNILYTDDIPGQTV